MLPKTPFYIAYAQPEKVENTFQPLKITKGWSWFTTHYFQPFWRLSLALFFEVFFIFCKDFSLKSFPTRFSYYQRSFQHISYSFFYLRPLFRQLVRCWVLRGFKLCLFNNLKNISNKDSSRGRYSQLCYSLMFMSSVQLIGKSSHFRQPWVFSLSIFLSTINFIWMFSFCEILSQEFFYLEFHFFLRLFLISNNVIPRFCLLIVSALFTFTCLDSIFMMIEHFLKFFNWNHVIGFRNILMSCDGSYEEILVSY